MGMLTAFGRSVIRDKDSPHLTERMRHMDIPTEMRWRARSAATGTDATTLSIDRIPDLALWRPGTPVLSVYVRNDPRDPANTAACRGGWSNCGA